MTNNTVITFELLDKELLQLFRLQLDAQHTHWATLCENIQSSPFTYLPTNDTWQVNRGGILYSLSRVVDATETEILRRQNKDMQLQIDQLQKAHEKGMYVCGRQYRYQPTFC